MKKLTLLSLLILSAGLAHADGRNPTDWSSQAIYKSTNVSGIGNSNNPAISTSPALIHTLTINSFGVNSKVEIFRSRQSTTANPMQDRIASIDTSTNNPAGYYLFDVYSDSGVMWHNYGQTPADVTMTYWNFKR